MTDRLTWGKEGWRSENPPKKDTPPFLPSDLWMMDLTAAVPRLLYSIRNKLLCSFLKPRVTVRNSAKRPDAHPATGIPSPSLAHQHPAHTTGTDRVNPRRPQGWPKHPAQRMGLGGRTFVAHPNWPHGLNSRSRLPALARFNFLIEISWKSCTFLISRPGMNTVS